MGGGGGGAPRFRPWLIDNWLSSIGRSKMVVRKMADLAVFGLIFSHLLIRMGRSAFLFTVLTSPDRQRVV